MNGHISHVCIVAYSEKRGVIINFGLFEGASAPLSMSVALVVPSESCFHTKQDGETIDVAPIGDVQER